MATESNTRPERRFLRVTRRRPVALYFDHGVAACSFAQLERVGRGGALLVCDRPVPVGTDVELAICLAGGVIEARARVLYHLDWEDGVAIGVELVAIDEDDAELLGRLAAPTPREIADSLSQLPPRLSRFLAPPGTLGASPA